MVFCNTSYCSPVADFEGNVPYNTKQSKQFSILYYLHDLYIDVCVSN